MKSIDNWTLGDFKWARKSTTPSSDSPTTIKDCDFFERRLSNDTTNIAKNLEQVAAKLIKIQQVELAYKTIPNIYTNLIKLIGSIDLNISKLGDLVILINLFKAHMTWSCMNHFTVTELNSFEFNKNTLEDLNTKDSLTEKYNISSMTEAISNNKYFIKCLMYKIQEQVNKKNKDDSTSNINQLLQTYDNIESLLNISSESQDQPNVI